MTQDQSVSSEPIILRGSAWHQTPKPDTTRSGNNFASLIDLVCSAFSPISKLERDIDLVWPRGILIDSAENLVEASITLVQG